MASCVELLFKVIWSVLFPFCIKICLPTEHFKNSLKCVRVLQMELEFGSAGF